MFSLIPSDAIDPQGLMRRSAPNKPNQTFDVNSEEKKTNHVNMNVLPAIYMNAIAATTSFNE